MEDCLDDGRLEMAYLEQLRDRRLERTIRDADGKVENVHFEGKLDLFCPWEHSLFGSSDYAQFLRYPDFPIAVQKGVSVSLVRNLRNILQWIHVATAFPTSQNILIKLNSLSSNGRVVGKYPSKWNVYTLAYPEFFEMNA